VELAVEEMKWLGRILLVGVLVLAGWWTWQRFFISDETRIKRAITAAEEAVEQGNVFKLEGFLTQDYSDHYGFDKSTVLAAVRSFRSQYDKVFIQLSGQTITIAADRQTAQVVLIAKVVAGSLNDPAAGEVRNERLRLHLRRTDSGWKLFRTETPELKFD
jgi:hypothetical protein